MTFNAILRHALNMNADKPQDIRNKPMHIRVFCQITVTCFQRREVRLFAMFEARPKSFRSKPLCAFDDCVHFVDHTPCVESA